MGNDLPQTRFRLLLEQLAEERGYGWRSDIAAKLGRHQTYIGRVASGERGPGLDDIAAAIRVWRLRPAFFFDPELGPEPDYHDHVETRLDPEDKVTALEEYLAERAELRPVAANVAERARSMALRQGIRTRAEAVLVVELAESILAREARDAAPAKDERAKVDEARGQRKADPGRFKRRR